MTRSAFANDIFDLPPGFHSATGFDNLSADPFNLPIGLDVLFNNNDNVNDLSDMTDMDAWLQAKTELNLADDPFGLTAGFDDLLEEAWVAAQNDVDGADAAAAGPGLPYGWVEWDQFVDLDQIE